MTVLVDRALAELLERHRLRDRGKRDRHGGEDLNDLSDRPQAQSQI